MKKLPFLANLARFSAVFALIISLVIPAGMAFAAVPTLSVTSYGSGTNQVQVIVNGDQNQNITLYYYNPIGSSNLSNVGVIGTTNSSGYFSTILNTSSYSIPAGTNVFVTVNGQQSSTAVWPSTTGGNVYLSQTNISLNQGQSYNVSISGGSSNGYYVSTNTNSGIVTTSVSGSVLTVYGANSGNANITVCSLGSTSACATLYVSVNGGYYNGGSIYLSQSNVTLNQGQSQSVSIYNNQSGNYYNSYNNYYISSNSNSSSVSATISGNTVTVYGSNTGYATIAVCSYYNGSYGNTSCANLYVTVNSYYYGNNYNNYSGYNYYPYNNYGYNYSNYSTFTPTYSQTYTPSYAYTPSYTYTSGQPVTGVFLSQVPATGAGEMFKIALFVLAILVWSAFVAYIINPRIFNLKGLNLSFAKGSASGKTLNKIQQFKEDQMKKRGLNQ